MVKISESKSLSGLLSIQYNRLSSSDGYGLMPEFSKKTVFIVVIQT
jgi:hypothetical protein